MSYHLMTSDSGHLVTNSPQGEKVHYWRLLQRVKEKCDKKKKKKLEVPEKNRL